MPTEQIDPKTIKVFFAYANEDETLLRALKKQFALLERQGTISTWCELDLRAGQERETTINAYLNAAHLILLLISPDFIHSSYCSNIEKRGLERLDAGEARVIPILLRPVLLSGAPFDHLEPLPADKRPVTGWPDRDEALNNIAKGVHKVVKEIQAEELLAEQWYQKGQEHYAAKQYTDALAAYDRANALKRNFAMAYNAKGDVFRRLGRYEEALAAHEQAIKYDPSSGWAWYGKANVLRSLIRYEEALVHYNKLTELEPDNAWAWCDKGIVLYCLRRYEEALAAFVRVIEIDPDNARMWHYKGEVLRDLGRDEEALVCYEHVLALDGSYMGAWQEKGYMLYERGRYEEALHAFEQVIVLKHDDVWAWYRKGNTLYRLKYYVDALEAYERVNGLDPHFADAYCDKGNALYQLERYKEALEAYEEVIKRARLPDRALVSKAWVGKARALKTLSDQALARAKELGVNLPPDWLFDLEL